MKDIKSILIGVFATTCLFLFMGQRVYDSELGRYQVSTTYGAYVDNGDWRTTVYETIIDTRTGNIITRSQFDARYYLKGND